MEIGRTVKQLGRKAAGGTILTGGKDGSMQKFITESSDCCGQTYVTGRSDVSRQNCITGGKDGGRVELENRKPNTSRQELLDWQRGWCHAEMLPDSEDGAMQNCYLTVSMVPCRTVT